MDKETRLDELINKKKISKGQSVEASSLLKKFFEETNNEKKTAEYLMKSKPHVYLSFFERFIADNDLERIKLLHKAIYTTESYKANHNNVSTTRGFILSAVLIKANNTYAQGALVRTLKDVSKGNNYSNSVIEIFRKNVIEYCGLDVINKLDEQEWENLNDHKRFQRFMQIVSTKIISTISVSTGDEQIDVVESRHLHIKKEDANATTFMQDELKKDEVTKKEKDKNYELAEGLTSILERSSREAKNLYQILNESNGMIGQLREQLTQNDMQLSLLSKDLHERDNNILANLSEIESLKSDLDRKQTKINDLGERLRNAMQMDTISHNQELVTLKSELANSLRLEYIDYQKDKDNECNQDTFIAFRASLGKIFKALRRYGIIIEEEVT